MKEYYAEVKLEFANLVEAKSKKEAVSIIKEMYKEQMKVYLKDSEIRNIKIHKWLILAIILYPIKEIGCSVRLHPS